MNAYVMKGMLLIALGAVLWGFSGMCSQFVQQQRMMSAEWVVAMRLVIAGVITVVAAFYQGRASIFKVFSDWKDTLRLVICGCANTPILKRLPMQGQGLRRSYNMWVLH